jgi:hypothetical protein
MKNNNLLQNNPSDRITIKRTRKQKILSSELNLLQMKDAIDSKKCKDQYSDLKKNIEDAKAIKEAADNQLSQQEDIIIENLTGLNNIAIIIDNNNIIINDAPKKTEDIRSELQILTTKRDAIITNISSIDQPNLDIISPIANNYEQFFNNSDLALTNKQNELDKCLNDLTTTNLPALEQDILAKKNIYEIKKTETNAIKLLMIPIEELEDQYKTCMDFKEGLLINKTYLENSLQPAEEQRDPHAKKVAQTLKAHEYATNSLNVGYNLKNACDKAISVSEAFVDYCDNEFDSGQNKDIFDLPNDESTSSYIKKAQFSCNMKQIEEDCAKHRALFQTETDRSELLDQDVEDLDAERSRKNNEKLSSEQLSQDFNNKFVNNLTVKQDKITKLSKDYIAKGIECDNIQSRLFELNFNLTRQNPRSVPIAQQNEIKARNDLYTATKVLRDANKFVVENCKTLKLAIVDLTQQQEYAKTYLEDSNFTKKLMEDNITIQKTEADSILTKIQENNYSIILISDNVKTSKQLITNYLVKKEDQFLVVENSQTDLVPYVNFDTIATSKYQTLLTKLASLKTLCSKLYNFQMI